MVGDERDHMTVQVSGLKGVVRQKKACSTESPMAGHYRDQVRRSYHCAYRIPADNGNWIANRTGIAAIMVCGGNIRYKRWYRMRIRVTLALRSMESLVLRALKEMVTE